jgi:hypothetical protein
MGKQIGMKKGRAVTTKKKNVDREMIEGYH